jgi:tetratricopeptide (TPR) repeat protein
MRAVLVACSWVMLPALAAAQETPQTGSDEEARGLFLAGQAAYNRDRFDDALDYFERSHELSGRPALLFNIGLAAAHAGRVERARAAFEQYLLEMPEAPNRTDVEARLARLSTADSPGEGGSTVPGWIAIGASGAAVIAGAIFFVLAASAASTVENPPPMSTWADVEGDYDAANAFTIAGFAAAGVGVAGIALGIVLVVTAGDDTQISAGLDGLRLSGTF